MMIAQETNITGYRKADTIRIDIKQHRRPDGTVLLNSAIALEPHPYRLTERLRHWADVAPERIFIGQRLMPPFGGPQGAWETLTYSETFFKVKAIAQALLQRN